MLTVQMLTVQILTVSLDSRLHQVAQRVIWVLKGRLSVPVVASVIGVAMVAWLIAGIRLRGAQLLLWLLVPVLALAASVCVAGPGRLFPKRAHEGRVVLLIARKDAITMLDLVGLSLAAIGVLLALALIGWRLRDMRQHPV